MSLKFEKVGSFWKQVNPKPFDYSLKYKENLLHTNENAMFRLGILSTYFSYEYMVDMKVLDFGCGTGDFVKHGKSVFKECVGYDVSGESISKHKLKTTQWDLITAFDVIEHLKDINSIFDLKWKYLYLSFPETPSVEKWEYLQDWRHFKPDEHQWLLNRDGMCKWAEENHCRVIMKGNYEDCLRKRWDPNCINISSMLIKRNI